MARLGILVAVTSCGLVAGGLVGLPAGQAAPVSAEPRTVTSGLSTIPGIETAGPIATVSASSGQTWPTAPRGVAVMPNGSVLSGKNPYVYVPSLKDVDSLPVRIVNVGSGRFDDISYTGTLSKGWETVGAELDAGGSYGVEVRTSTGDWRSVGSFSVAIQGSGAGPSVSAGGVSASVVTGEASYSWASRSLTGPRGGVGVGLSWGSGSSASPGLPAGWRLVANSGSPWAKITESTTVEKAALVPAVPSILVRGTTAKVSMAYPASALNGAKAVVVATKTRTGEWKVAGSKPVDTANIPAAWSFTVPASSTSQVRVGVRAEGTTLWSTPVALATTRARKSAAPVAIAGAGTGSIITAGVAPAVMRLVGWDGAYLTFVRNALGVYEQAGGSTAGFTNVLTRVSDSSWEFTDSQGVVTTFVNGNAVKVTALDQPVSNLEWDTSGRLVRVINEIGRSIVMQYGSECAAASWSGWASVPNNGLCSITYPGGDTVDIGYVAVGSGSQIGLIKNPGNVGNALGWDTKGRLVSTRSALVNRVATTNPTAKAVVSRVRYDSTGRVASLISAPATVGGPTVTQTVTYPVAGLQDVKEWLADESVPNAVTASMSITGVVGYALGETYSLNPVTWQTVRKQNASGLAIQLDPDAKNGQIASARDAQGLSTKYEYNDLGLVTKSSGPFNGSGGAVMESNYDTKRVQGKDVPLSGLRAQIYSDVQYAGNTEGRFLESSASRGGLSTRWDNRSSTFSAQASGIWTPSDAQDALGAEKGWQFSVSVSGGSEISFLVNGIPCDVSSVCVIKDLPKGPKSVLVQLPRAARSGWFQVTAAPVGSELAVIDTTEIAPGYALTSVSKSNDMLTGSADGARTDYSFADPSTQRVTSVTAPGNLSTTMSYETSVPESNTWGRLTTVTTPGGEQTRTTYWANSGTEATPAFCGSKSAVMSGQPKTVTRQDGSTVTTYYDIAGRVLATVVTGTDGLTVTSCSTYRADGSLATKSTYDHDGVLIEQSVSEVAVGGNPLVASVTVTHGPAAPVNPGTSISSSTTVDLGGRPVEQTDPSGVVTTTTYDALGNVTRTVVTPPAAAAAQTLTFEYTYDRLDGTVKTATVNGVLAASADYSAKTGNVSSVTYPDGTTVAYTRAGNGVVNRINVNTSDGRFSRVVSANTLSAFGRIESASLTVTGTEGITRSSGYAYDAAGRLSRANITSTPTGGSATRSNFGYAFAATQSGTCASEYVGAGKDNLRTGGSRNGISYVSCHDAKGRLVSTTDPLLTGGSGSATLAYDGFGRVTSVNADRDLALTWGAGTGVASITETGTGGTVTTQFDRYGSGIVGKTVTSTAGTESVRYAAPYILAESGDTVTGTAGIQYSLPGGAMVNTKPGSTATLTINGVDGSAIVTVPVPSLGSGVAAAPGPVVGVSPAFGPYGETLSAPATDTASALPTYSWQAARGQETLAGSSSITLMGARPYLPATGEFMAMDPQVDSGSNLYGYTDGDPINQSDRSGNETEDTLIAGGSAAAGFIASLLVGFIAGKSGTALAKGIAGLVGTVASAGVGYGAYLATKSATDDENISIGVAVAAALATAGATFGTYRWGASKARTARQSRSASTISEAPNSELAGQVDNVRGSQLVEEPPIVLSNETAVDIYRGDVRPVDPNWADEFFANTRNAGETNQIFRKLGLEFHPDKGKRSAEQFQAISNARQRRLDWLADYMEENGLIDYTAYLAEVNYAQGFGNGGGFF